MRGTLVGVLVAVGAGLFATTNVSAAPVINGAAIGEAASTSLLIELVQHRREESRERGHRREESRERGHRREESREREHRREESRERRHRREESRERR
jgi:hypothetical protein